ncbi:MAG: recombinase family protein [Ilumatobacteraceae bacterium]
MTKIGLHDVRVSLLRTVLDMNVIAYLRVSTEEQARSGLGLEAQRTRIEEEAQRREWAVTWLTDDGYTASNLERPALTTALVSLRNKDATVLVVSKLDRLSRSLLDFAGLMQRAKDEGWSLIALDLGVDMTTPSGALVANVMASFAEFERQLISERTRVALQALRARGQRLGRPTALPQATRARIGQWRAAGVGLAAIADHLNASGTPTAHGGRQWYPSTVRGVIRSLSFDTEAEMMADAS